jgi:hypothetical protein
MPEAAIPFKLNSKSFIIAFVVIMIAVRVVLILLSSVVRRSCWWRKLKEHLTTIQLYLYVANSLGTGEYSSGSFKINDQLY